MSLLSALHLQLVKMLCVAEPRDLCCDAMSVQVAQSTMTALASEGAGALDTKASANGATSS